MSLGSSCRRRSRLSARAVGSSSFAVDASDVEVAVVVEPSIDGRIGSDNRNGCSARGGGRVLVCSSAIDAVCSLLFTRASSAVVDDSLALHQCESRVVCFSHSFSLFLFLSLVSLSQRCALFDSFASVVQSLGLGGGHARGPVIGLARKAPARRRFVSFVLFFPLPPSSSPVNCFALLYRT